MTCCWIDFSGLPQDSFIYYDHDEERIAHGSSQQSQDNSDVRWEVAVWEEDSGCCRGHKLPVSQ